MLEVINYLAFGIVILMVTAVMHIMKAEKKGYKAWTWWINNLPVNSLENKFFISYIIVCLLIWPIKVLRFVMHTNEYYKLYERKNQIKE